MFTSRLFGGTPTTSSPRSRMRPSSGSSKPATMRIVVVLPQPDGPSSVMNSPSAMSSEMSSTACDVAERLAHALDADRRRRSRSRHRTSSSSITVVPARARRRSTSPKHLRRDRRRSPRSRGSRRPRRSPAAAVAGSRSCEYRYTGNVTSSPATNEAITTSSNEITKPSRNAEKIAGIISGNVIWRNVVNQPCAEVARRLLERRGDPFEPRHEREDRERQRDHDVADRDRESARTGSRSC